MTHDRPIHTETAPASSGAGSPEGELVARIASGDRRAFERLYRAYLPRLTRFLQQLTRQPQAIEEAINDTMLVVWRRASTYTGTSKVSTWIFAIAYRRSLKLLKQFDTPVEGDDGEEPATDEAPEGAVMQKQLHRALAAAMKQVPAEQRAVIELTYYHGCAYREIAEILGCPVDTVKTRMFHARRRLRQLLSEQREDLP
jgi:RNA polymerase sigma-70 factor (ECF subfamily)